MKKLLPIYAFLAVAATWALMSPVVAEDPKAADMDLFDNDTYGIKIWKPKGKDQWKIVGAGGWKNAGFENDPLFLLQKWPADNKDGDRQKSPPLVSMYGFRYDTQGKYKIGDWEGTPSSTKGFAKALFDDLMAKQYKNPKNVAETAKHPYPCGTFYEFSCYAEHKKYGGSFYVRVAVVKRDAKDTYLLQVETPPGEELVKGKDGKERSGAEIEAILQSIKFYDLKK